MSRNLMLTICLGSLLAPGLLALASFPSVADETLELRTVVTLPLLPNGSQSVLRSFDISFVDPITHTYALAASALFGSGTGPASQPGIVAIDTRTKFVKLLAVGQFAGVCPSPAPAGIGGPNGVIVIEKGSNADIWAGDGPIFTPSCAPNATNTNVVTYSNVKVLDLHTGAIKKVISTGGVRRADELCYNPLSDVVLIANDEPTDNFITFIGEDSYNVLGKIKFDGTDPNGNKIVANGIEQCKYNPRDGKFYINLPATGTTATPGPGMTLRISAFLPFHVEAAFTISSSTGCNGGSGLAVGPDHQLALACGGTSTNSLIIDDRNGNTIAVVANEGGPDEAWYNRGSNHYYFARSAAAVLGVEDAGPPPQADTPDTPTGQGSHSVAADQNKNQVYVPIRSSTFDTTPPPLPTICSSKGGFDNLGCIAVYDSPSDTDDCIADDNRVIGVNRDGDPQFRRQRCVKN
jgi:hypothetical protein